MNFLKKASNTVGHTAENVAGTAAKDVGMAKEAIFGGGHGDDHGRSKTVTVVNDGSAQGGDTVIITKTTKGGGHGGLANKAGGILHTAAVMATDAADTVYVKPVVLAADLAANALGQDEATMFHAAEEKLRETVIGAADTVVVSTAVTGVDAVESMFGGHQGTSEEVVVIKKSGGEQDVGSNVQPVETNEVQDNSSVVVDNSSSQATSTTTYQYSFQSTGYTPSNNEVNQSTTTTTTSVKQITITYDATYPITRPIITPAGIQYRIGIIADLDRDSKAGNDLFVSNLQKGYLTWNPKQRTVSVSWDKESLTLVSNINEGGRGMELSELNVYNGKLYTCDDKTGVLYEIDGNTLRVFTKICDGDGSTEKGFKCEWGTVKNGILYIGGHGTMTFSPSGEVTHINNEWVKKVLPTGDVYHANWHRNYQAIRNALGVQAPGYVVHESCCWSDIHNKWFFMPRKINNTAFEDEKDETSCTNLLLSCDDEFKEVSITKIGPVVPDHGFSSFKFVPDTNDSVIIAIKSKEHGGVTASYIMVFTINGEILMEETEISALKYEGIEFV